MEILGSFAGYFCIGLVLLAVIILFLELLGISLLGGERKPGFIVRLILIIVLSCGLGWAFCTYITEMPFYQDTLGSHLESCSDCNDPETVVDEAADMAGEMAEDAADAADEAADMAEDTADAAEEAADITGGSDW